MEKSEKSKEEIAAERKKRKEEEAEQKKKAKEKKEQHHEINQISSKNKEPKNILHETYQSNAKLVRKNKGQPIYVDANKKNILITSALPYVNNEPHLGNIIGCVLSADVFARYSRLIGNNTLYICGTDEYGTATEIKAIQDGCTPKELCDKYFTIHKEIYDWFDIDFDIFGRTPTEIHKEITLDIFNKLKKNKYIQKQKVKQFRCAKCERFLSDRFLTGTCNNENCGYEGIGGDQCDLCGKLIVAIEIKDPKCKLCGSVPELCDSFHYFIDLPKIEPELQKWLSEACNQWTKNSVSISKGFLNEGLKPRCITRDLKWGVSVPCEDDEDLKDKVFYVWFDAPIGYLSITGNLLKERWQEWWKNPDEVQLYQFMGKDNVTFHTIIFPSTLLGTEDKYTKVNYLSTTEYLNYETDKFSKSRGVGVFGRGAMETGIPSEVWRYYLLSIRPENGDTEFYWDKFAEKVNTELKNNLGNLCHRVFSFVFTKFDKKIPLVESIYQEDDLAFVKKIEELFISYIELLDKVKLKEGLETVMRISAEANNYLQKTAAWEVFKKDKQRCAVIMNVLVAAVRFIACLAEPFIPSFSAKVYEILNVEYDQYAETLLKTFLDSKTQFNKVFLELALQGKEIKECLPLFASCKFLFT